MDRQEQTRILASATDEELEELRSNLFDIPTTETDTTTKQLDRDIVFAAALFGNTNH